MLFGPLLSITGFTDLHSELFQHCALSSPNSANITQHNHQQSHHRPQTEHNTCETIDEFISIRTGVSGSWAKRD